MRGCACSRRHSCSPRCHRRIMLLQPGGGGEHPAGGVALLQRGGEGWGGGQAAPRPAQLRAAPGGAGAQGPKRCCCQGGVAQPRHPAPLPHRAVHGRRPSPCRLLLRVAGAGAVACGRQGVRHMMQPNLPFQRAIWAALKAARQRRWASDAWQQAHLLRHVCCWPAERRCSGGAACGAAGSLGAGRAEQRLSSDARGRAARRCCWKPALGAVLARDQRARHR